MTGGRRSAPPVAGARNRITAPAACISARSRHDLPGVDRLRERLDARRGGEKCERLEDGVAVQGGWWYRGEYRVTPLGDERSRVVHEVANVAPPATRWLVPLVVRSSPERHRQGFLGLLGTVGEVREAG